MFAGQLTEIYAIPDGSRFILYAPLKGVALLVNSDAISLLARLQKRGVLRQLTHREIAFIETLVELGFLQDNNGNNNSFCQDTSAGAHKMADVDFAPTSTTLFLTYNCNLRCVYCYSFGGEQPIDMPFEIAKKSIDFVVSNALRLGKTRVGLGFHGGGEPTLNWRVLTKSVEYAKALALSNKLDLSISLATNGCLSVHQAQWVMQYINHVTVSIDGPSSIQDTQRPLRNGQGSYRMVYATLKLFDEANYQYGLRVTVSDKSLPLLEEIVVHLCKNFGARDVHVEPLFECGRCYTSGLEMPDPNEFISRFLRSAEIARQYGVNLIYSGLRLNGFRTSFCGVTAPNFVVLPQGEVTSCFEVCRPNDKRSNTFFYGKYSFHDGQFYFDKQKIKMLRNKNIKSFTYCARCFIKWHCGGECVAKSTQEKGMYIPDKARCTINRELAKSRLREIIQETRDV